MTKSVYVVGGALTGKSTFMACMIEDLGLRLSPVLEDLHTKPNNGGNLVTLRGHRGSIPDGREGLYLGVIRESFPGTDGLDRATSPTGEEWLRTCDLPDFIVAEGATLATRRFISALHDTTELLLVHLVCDEDEKRARATKRGSDQDWKFVVGTSTRMANLVSDQRNSTTVPILGIDTGSEEDWEIGLDIAVSHILAR